MPRRCYMKSWFIRGIVRAALLVVVAMATKSEAHATVRRVPADYPTIQQAINASVNSDTVLVSPGTYVENINFLGKAIRVISESGSSVTTIDGNHLGSVVTFNSGEGLTSELSGFTVQNGAVFLFENGSGINIQNSSPTITANTIINNTGNDGGGIRVGGGSPFISNNAITDNSTGGFGGGIFAGGS